MNSKYQIVYLDKKEKPQTLEIYATSETAARTHGQKYGLNVIGVNFIHDVQDIVDWNKPTFSVEEAGLYCGYGRTQWHVIVSLGKVSFVQDGNGQKRFRRVDLDAYLASNRFVENRPAPSVG